MSIRQIYTESAFRNFCYLIINEQDAICIDPFEGGPIGQILESEGLTLSSIINTHEHWDHIQGNDFLKDKYGCPVYAHHAASKKIPTCTDGLKEGDHLKLGDISLEVLDTPGHTMSHLCILVRQRDKVLGVLTGDTLFNAGVGNCHNGGDPAVLYETITKKIGALSDEVPVYPGHDYLENNLRFTLSITPENKEAHRMLDQLVSAKEKYFNEVTTIGKERQINTFMHLDNRSLRNSLKLIDADDKKIFLRLRELRNSW